MTSFSGSWAWRWRRARPLRGRDAGRAAGLCHRHAERAGGRLCRGSGRGAAAVFPQPPIYRPHWPWSSPSVEAAARQREVDRSEIIEGGSTRIYGEMMQILDAGIGRVIAAVQRNPAGRETFIIFTSANGGERFSQHPPFLGRKV